MFRCSIFIKEKLLINILLENQDDKPIKISINNTTNSIDGVFSPMKKYIKIHNWFTKSLKLKFVDDYLVSYKKKWKIWHSDFSSYTVKVSIN